MTLNRFCGSGLQAVTFGAMGVASGAPGSGCRRRGREHVARGHRRRRRRPGRPQPAPAPTRTSRSRRGSAPISSRRCEGFSRDDAGSLRARSQARAAAAQDDGAFERSLSPVRDPDGKVVLLEADEYPRPNHGATGSPPCPRPSPRWDRRSLSPDGETYDQVRAPRLPAREGDPAPSTRRETPAGSSTARPRSPGVARRYLDRTACTPRARIGAFASVGTEPVFMLTAPAPASRKALAHASMTPADIDLWEINEAFAAVVLQTIRRARDRSRSASTSTAARSRSAIRSAPRARCSSVPPSTSSSAAIRHRSGHPLHRRRPGNRRDYRAIKRNGSSGG